ncbi:sigma-54-dependent transcriptional regulator [Methylobrevis albus]|uniref:Sigma-54-dependent Fis family transcriptional regulator n=1 Tax=Methylobrevis albus TaxID=2793297 RepID=A0A931I1Q3_9HYPH|nr:sigma 54-interacting transcriptional regulator [Methylobrevis albus]MBH0238197.1 sigma-54-dependent Fis family transcriptional regulator [Methylobrevis albus]
MGFALRPSAALRILLVDADPAARTVLKRALEQRIARPLMILETASPEAARMMLGEQSFAVLSLDLDTVGGIDGFTALTEVARATLIYAAGDASQIGDAVAVVRAGAADYLTKPLDGAAFARRVERHFAVAATPAPEAATFEGLVGRSAAMRTLFDQVGRIAPAEAPVFVSGEAGSGRKAIAAALHARSRRSEGPLVVVDCDGIDGDRLLDQIAGSNGALRRAHGGSLVLAEVGRLPAAVQAALVRFVSTGEVVGAVYQDVPPRADVRLIALTEHRPDELVRSGAMRSDLFYRLNVLGLAVPPLRERPDDVAPIAESVLRRSAADAGRRFLRLAPAAERLLTGHDWPGNVRELETLVQRIALLCDGETLTPEHLADAGFGARRGSVPRVAAEPAPVLGTPVFEDEPAAARAIRPLWMVEAEVIEAAIDAFEGNIARAAAALEISPSTIYRKRRGGPAEDGGARDGLPQTRVG